MKRYSVNRHKNDMIILQFQSNQLPEKVKQYCIPSQKAIVE